MIELTKQRSYNRKVFDLGNGQNKYRFSIAHKHYKDGSNFKDIDTRLIFKEGYWRHNKASYFPAIPEYADSWFEFYNNFEGANHTIKARPIVSHVKGVLQADNTVLYSDAFGDGIDLKVIPYWHGIKKVICINEKPADTSTNLTFDFELELPAPSKDKVKDKLGNLWDKTSKLNFKDKTLKIGEEGHESYFTNARVWDSGKTIFDIETKKLTQTPLNQYVDIELYVKDGKTYLRKTITSDILEKAVYPLYTDHPTNYSAGAGDGEVRYNQSDSGTWTQCRDASTGTTATDDVDTADYGAYSQGPLTGSNNYGIGRVFLPIDTDGITGNITDATLYHYHNGNNSTYYDPDSKNLNYMVLVQTTQASTSGLATSDYSEVNIDTAGSDNTTSITSENGYRGKDLNATGIGWINKTGYTKLGFITGYDHTNDAMEGILIESLFFSEYAGTDHDPYLEVTTGAVVIKVATNILNTSSKYWS